MASSATGRSDGRSDPRRHVQGNVDQAEKWGSSARAAIFQRYMNKTREAITRARRSCSGRNRRRRSCSRRIARPRSSSRASRARRTSSILFGSDQVERGTAGSLVQRGVSGRPDGNGGGHLPKDPSRAVRRVRAAQAAVCLRGGADRSGSGRSRRARSAALLPVAAHRISTAICYEIVYPALVRDVRRGRQRAVDDDHQRRVVRRDVGAVSALRAGVDAGDRGRALHGPLRQHRASAASSIRTAACSRARRSTSRPSWSATVRFLRDSTFYARLGDIFAYRDRRS